jgi:tryptophan halogenase
MIKDLLVLGAGSAGLLAALAIKRRLPQTKVRVLRSPEIGTIAVGESTTPNVPAFLFDYLNIDRRRFYQSAEPTWKLGIHFLWGPRPCFEYPFVVQMDARHNNLPRPNGFYCDTDFTAMNPQSALMAEGKVFLRRADGTPEIDSGHAFHLENAKFVKTLERVAESVGVQFIDGKLRGAEQSAEGISSVILEDGRQLQADFFIDASGFRSELLGKVLEEPFISFDRSLFNDRAILGTWERTDEPILPYTTAETMDAGWSWQIDHERSINRGYVYSSSHVSDQDARSEFARKNPKAKTSDRIVGFRTGRYQRSWVGNVMAVGNAFGFVEPLEATALMITCWHMQSFADLIQFVGDLPSIRNLFNRLCGTAWDEIRDFLTLHFKTNTRLETPYWRHCRAEADAPRLHEILDFYRENGPTGFARYILANPESQFGIEGYLVQLVGNKVPYRNAHHPSATELQLVTQLRNNNRMVAKKGLTAVESLAIIRHPNWRWASEISGRVS